MSASGATDATAGGLITVAERAALDIGLAPSVHNTQPWRVVVHDDELDLFAVPARALAVLDPTGREQMVSVGCALMNARVSFAGSRVTRRVVVDRLPAGTDADHVAALRLVPSAETADDRVLARLRPSIAVRHTNRRHYEDEPVPMAVVDDLIAAAALEDTRLVPILTEEHRATIARLTQWADREQREDPAYRAELREWTGTEPGRFEGVDPGAVPHVDGHAEDDVPIRDFDTDGHGALPSRTRSGIHQCLLLLASGDDTRAGWLRAGEALQRVLLELTRRGYVASIFTQPIEVDYVRERLRGELGIVEHPIALLRVGHAAPTPAAPHLPFSEVTTSR